MAALNKTDDPFTTADFTNRTPNAPGRNGLRDWIEGNRPTTTDAAGPRLVQDDLANSAAGNIEAVTPLLSESEIAELRSRWNNIQAEFVDEPQRSVQEADQLVANTVQRLAEAFANERVSLEKQWNGRDSVSTEDLRIALQRYRAFFGRLLNAA